MINIKKLDKGLDFLERVETLIAVIILISVILINFLEIIGRYLFSRPLGWPHELSLYLIVWFAYFTLSILVKRGELIKMNFFYDKFSKTKRKIITLGYNIMLLITSILMIKYSFELEKVQRARNLVTLNLPQAIGLYGFMIALFSIIFIVSINIYKDVLEIYD